MAVIEKYSKCKKTEEFIEISTDKQVKYIKIFRSKGLSIRQISRLTGVSKGIVERN